MICGSVEALLSLPPGCVVQAIVAAETTLTIEVVSTCPQSACPLCGHLAWRVRSHYERTVADVPCGGRRLILKLGVRKFHCHTADCPRTIFAERLPDFLQSFARQTNRLKEALLAIGFATCGKAGAKLAPQVGMRITPTTLLRQMHALPLPPVGPVSHIGIDDFAWKKGHRYGTIVVNVLTHQVIDLLPDRTTESVNAWLSAHPEIEILSRDRGGTYADGGRQGAPQARQVADRWHIMSNLGEAVERFLLRERIHIPPQAPDGAPGSEKASALDLPALSLADPSPFSPASARWQERYREVQELHAQGKSLHAIAKQLSLARNTVRRYVRQAHSAEPTLARAPRPHRKSQLDAHHEYLLKRWQEEEHNATHLLSELRERGYTGSASSSSRVSGPSWFSHTRSCSQEGRTNATRSTLVALSSTRQAETRGARATHSSLDGK
jgi:transposase